MRGPIRRQNALCLSEHAMSLRTCYVSQNTLHLLCVVLPAKLSLLFVWFPWQQCHHHGEEHSSSFSTPHLLSLLHFIIAVTSTMSVSELESAHKLSYRFIPLTRKLQDNVVICCGKEEWDELQRVCVSFEACGSFFAFVHSFFFLLTVFCYQFLCQGEKTGLQCWWCVEWLSSIHFCLICARVCEVSFTFPFSFCSYNSVSLSCNFLISITQSS